MAEPSRISAAGLRAAFSAHRLNAIDATIWLVAIAAYFVVPSYLSLGTTVLIMILFTLSLDLAVGYGGIDTLGQSAFYGLGGDAPPDWGRHLPRVPRSGRVGGAGAPADHGDQ
jgi:branched-chain amino acid transport system permease protein